jgi:hypothetical protein
MNTETEESVAVSIAYSLRRIADSLEKLERRNRSTSRRANESLADIAGGLRGLWWQWPRPPEPEAEADEA